MTRGCNELQVRLAVREGGTRHHVLTTGNMLSVADAPQPVLKGQTGRA